jgi:serine/threonine-protein kinase
MRVIRARTVSIQPVRARTTFFRLGSGIRRPRRARALVRRVRDLLAKAKRRAMRYEEYRVGAVVGGALRLERLAALGGYGAVFEARDLRSGARYALKVLRPGDAAGEERRRARFLREARIAMRLTSPGAVRILDVVTPGEGPPYLVMEYLEGETLAARLRRCGPLPVGEAVRWILQAIEPLAEMHAAGIIHRDVKPSNLFVVEEPGRAPRIKLLDFGIVTPDPATEAAVDLTRTDAELGTPLYMPPEQFLQAKYVDARADVWSLGVTLFELLAGRVPFVAPTVAGLSLRILYDEPEPLEQARPDAPAALAAILLKCLAKAPAARVPDVRALATALAPFAAPEPEDEETLDATVDTPLPQTVPAIGAPKRTRWVQAGAIALGVLVWLSTLVAMRREATRPPRAVSTPEIEAPAIEAPAPHGANDAIVEQTPAPTTTVVPRGRVVADPHPPAAHAPRPVVPAVAPVRRAPPPPARPITTPRPARPATPASPEPELVDDRIL